MLKNKKFFLVAGVLLLGMMLPTSAGAAQLTQASLRLGRLGEGASANNDVYVTFKLNSTPTTVAKIIITIPTGFTVTAGTPTPTSVNTTNQIPAASLLPGTLTASATSAGAGAGGTITISGLTSASLNATTLYDVDIPTGTVTNPATPGLYGATAASPMTVASANSSGTPIDTTTTPTYIYGASPNQDQVVVNASVAPNFQFNLSANSDTIPVADPTSRVTSSGVTMTVSTNSPLGYTAYVASANNKLVSATNPNTPITTGTFDGTPDVVTPGTTDYGFVPTLTVNGSSVSTGSTAATSGEYAVADGTHSGSFGGANVLDSFASRNGYTSGDQYSLQERVSVGQTVGYAKDYTDTLTIVAAGNY